MMWAVIKWTPQLIASNFYVTIEAVEFNIGEGSCVFFIYKDTLLPYNVQPCNEANMDNIEAAEVLAAIHTREVGGLVTEMNMFKAMWMRHSILMPIEMCTKSSLIMIVQRTILNSLMNYNWNTMWTHAPF